MLRNAAGKSLTAYFSFNVNANSIRTREMALIRIPHPGGGGNQTIANKTRRRKKNVLYNRLIGFPTASLEGGAAGCI